MRFMLIMFPENYPTAKAGWVPDLTDIEDSRKFHEEMGAAGVLQALDGLTPPATMSARVTLKNGKVKVTDGPFTEAKEVVGGYYIIDVKSREEAIEWASRIPKKGWRNGYRSPPVLRYERLHSRRAGQAHGPRGRAGRQVRR